MWENIGITTPGTYQAWSSCKILAKFDGFSQLLSLHRAWTGVLVFRWRDDLGYVQQ